MATTVTAPSRSTSGTTHRVPPRRGWIVPACTLVVLVLYAVSALALGRDAAGTDVHRRQAAALADGHLDIRPVPASLAELDDPYDPGANLDVRVDEGVQDLAYRDGRLYSAHGLTVPVLLLPSELLLGTSPPNWAITLLGGWCGVLAGTWALLQVRRRFVPATSDAALGAAVLAVGLCGPVWVLMSVANGYEAAIAVAFALTTTGVALLLRATETLPSLGRGRAALGAACLAAAIGSRPTAVVTAIVVAVVVGVVVASNRAVRAADGDADRDGPARPGGAVALDVAAVVAPFLAVGTLVAVSNVVRFGAASEFGFGYQLSVWDMTAYPKGRLAYLLPNLADYLGAAPRPTGSFPWIGLRPTVGGTRPEDHTSEPIAGLLYLAPVLIVGAIALGSSARDLWSRGRALAVVIATAAATGTAALVAVSLPFNTSTLRYAADAAPLLLLAAAGSWLWARSRTTTSTTDAVGAGRTDRRTIDVAWVVALVVGAVLTAAVQIGA
ncbi:hypothetical protein [Dermatobacter hominis]|uniref:hypothetical protein n=1 Tax=Dermatobacter hominis TaxID=2884263 RepID=UPI001D10BA96|nr:hypothetical protein [Dermatobacter hominis]UDY36766.1 hypothetical protein LH044_04315 [Dermatobacter hominis]